MAFVLTHHVAAVRGSAVLDAGQRVAGRLRGRVRYNLTPQQRANLYVSRMPIAVIAG